MQEATDHSIQDSCLSKQRTAVKQHSSQLFVGGLLKKPVIPSVKPTVNGQHNSLGRSNTIITMGSRDGGQGKPGGYHVNYSVYQIDKTYQNSRLNKEHAIYHGNKYQSHTCSRIAEQVNQQQKQRKVEQKENQERLTSFWREQEMRKSGKYQLMETKAQLIEKRDQRAQVKADVNRTMFYAKQNDIELEVKKAQDTELAQEFVKVDIPIIMEKWVNISESINEAHGQAMKLHHEMIRGVASSHISKRESFTEQFKQERLNAIQKEHKARASQQEIQIRNLEEREAYIDWVRNLYDFDEEFNYQRQRPQSANAV